MKMDKVQPAIDADEEKPLDPAMERVRRKMVRLLAISIGTMMIGIFAVLFAVVNKASNVGNPGPLQTYALDVPSGFTVQQTSATRDRITLQVVDATGQVRILIYDATSGAMVTDAAIRQANGQ